MSLYEDLISNIGSTDFFINDVNFKDLGKIIILDHSISPPILKTSSIEFNGINGSLDTTFDIFKEPRYDDRFIDLDFMIVADTRKEALSTIKAINEYMGKGLRIKKDTRSPFYFSGRVEKGVEYSVAREGVANCQISFRVFPLSIQDYDNGFLWDDIVFEDYYFNDYTHVISSDFPVGKDIDFYLPNPLPNELIIYSNGNNIVVDSVLGTNISLIKGLNYIPIAPGTTSPMTINVRSTDGEPTTISISLEVGVLEYV